MRGLTADEYAMLRVVLSPPGSVDREGPSPAERAALTRLCAQRRIRAVPCLVRVGAIRPQVTGEGLLAMRIYDAMRVRGVV